MLLHELEELLKEYPELRDESMKRAAEKVIVFTEVSSPTWKPACH